MDSVQYHFKNYDDLLSFISMVLYNITYRPETIKNINDDLDFYRILCDFANKIKNNNLNTPIELYIENKNT